MHFIAPTGNFSQNRKEVIKALVFFIPSTILGGLTLLLPNIGKRVNKKDQKRSFKYEVTIVVIVKNETPYIDEWIAYHHLIGVDRFVIYDNDSDDNLLCSLKKYMDMGLVEYVHFSGLHQQVPAYSDALVKYREKTRYLGYLDIDEFIVIHNDINLKDLLFNHFEKYPCAGGLAIQWYMYGSSGHKAKPDGLVMKNYLHRAPVEFNPAVKTIGNPRLMKCIVNAHNPIYKINVYSLNEVGEKVFGMSLLDISPHNIHINHYFTKSEEECRAKFERGQVALVPKYKWDAFTRMDRNDVYDDTLLNYVPKVERYINLLK